MTYRLTAPEFKNKVLLSLLHYYYIF